MSARDGSPTSKPGVDTRARSPRSRRRVLSVNLQARARPASRGGAFGVWDEVVARAAYIAMAAHVRERALAIFSLLCRGDHAGVLGLTCYSSSSASAPR